MATSVEVKSVLLNNWISQSEPKWAKLLVGILIKWDKVKQNCIESLERIERLERIEHKEQQNV